MPKDTTQPSYHTARFANHLATRTERIASAGKRLPTGLHKRMLLLEHLSQLARITLANIMPAEALANLTVINHNTHYLTISVIDATTASHIRHLKEVCLAELNVIDEFKTITHLKVIVVSDLAKTYQNKQPNFTQKDEPKVNFSHFGEDVRRTITQAIQNVTPDSELELQLKKLFNQE